MSTGKAPERVPISIRVPAAMLKAARLSAAKSDESVSHMILVILRDGLVARGALTADQAQKIRIT